MKKQTLLGSFLCKSCVLIAIFIFGPLIYFQLSFPFHLRDLSPQLFDSHESKLLLPLLKDFKAMNPKFLDQPNVGKCEDIQIADNHKAYCINDQNSLIQIRGETENVHEITKFQKGKAIGIKLSKDKKILYFVNSEMGLCEYNFEKNETKSLVKDYKGEFLESLNSIEVHPTKPNLIYFSQASSRIPLDIYQVDIMLNNPLGRLFEFNKKTSSLTLLTEGLYFANGVVFQKYRNSETLLVLETSRLRLIRFYLNGPKKGQKQVVVDKFDLYPDNLKQNEKGQLWIGGPSARNQMIVYSDHTLWLRRILSRFPLTFFKYLPQQKFFGGIKLIFSEDKQKCQVQYHVWQAFKDYKFATTLNQKNNQLYISSLETNGIWFVDKFNQKLQKVNQIKNRKAQKQDL